MMLRKVNGSHARLMVHTQVGLKKTYATEYQTGTSLIQVDVSYAARGFRNIRTPTIIKVDFWYIVV